MFCTTTSSNQLYRRRYHALKLISEIHDIFNGVRQLMCCTHEAEHMAAPVAEKCRDVCGSLAFLKRLEDWHTSPGCISCTSSNSPLSTSACHVLYLRTMVCPIDVRLFILAVRRMLVRLRAQHLNWAAPIGTFGIKNGAKLVFTLNCMVSP